MIIFARLLILQNSNRRMDWSNRCGKYERNNWSYNYFWNRNIPLYLKSKNEERKQRFYFRRQLHLWRIIDHKLT
jgi:hypothetical protein